MRYRYEALNEYTFQQLAQALILVEHPGAQCLPVSQPDGGRDAFVLHETPDQSRFLVFQVKFSRDPESKSERQVVLDTIASESAKVDELVRRGATDYRLVTNVRGTAHLDSGSVDRANAALTEELGVPGQIWWRDDIDRRLDNSSDIRWAYAEILNASDVLPLLARQLGDSDNLQSARTFKSYVASQYSADRDVKFKQVELARTLTELFVDLPLGAKSRHDDADRHGRSRPAARTDLDDYVDQLDLGDEYDEENGHPFDHSGHAAAFFLQIPYPDGVSNLSSREPPGRGSPPSRSFSAKSTASGFYRKPQNSQPSTPITYADPLAHRFESIFATTRPG